MRPPSAPARLKIVRIRIRAVLAVAGTMVLLSCAPAKEKTDDKVLRMVPQFDLEILDPFWTTALITQNHGYMIYDTLFGTDTDGHISPQMVDTYDVSADQKTWTFTLRDDLEFHDGMAVASDDVIASLQRWGQRDITGRKLMSFVQKLEAVFLGSGPSNNIMNPFSTNMFSAEASPMRGTAGPPTYNSRSCATRSPSRATRRSARRSRRASRSAPWRSARLFPSVSM